MKIVMDRWLCETVAERLVAAEIQNKQEGEIMLEALRARLSLRRSIAVV
jgi:hypothetical protein